jgi:O-antigen/teichoic acid export membrane protein
MSTITTGNTRELTSGRQLARSTLWNFGASIASILIALVSVPILIKYLGAERFGVISLVWVVEGQFSLFDLGLSRALTKLVAEKLGISREMDIPAIFWSALLMMGVAGVVAGILLRALSPWLVHSILKVPANIQPETLTSFYLVALSLPVVISSAGLRGYLEAHQRFDLISSVRVPISILSYLVPLLVLPFSKTLVPVIVVLISGRFLAWAIHLSLCFRVSPALRKNMTVEGAPLRYMFSFGGWMTVTNVVSPIMVNLDRFLIGALISMSAVAYYVTPYEAVTKLWIIPSALSGVLFPAFATALGQDRNRAALLFEKAVTYTFLSLFPVIVGVLALGHFGLQIWLGAAFAQKCSLVLSFLAIGVFANSLAQVPFWQIQAASRPDWAAKVHLIELPFYLLAFWALTKRYGINGAAAAWMLRTVVDTTIMFWLSSRLLHESKPAIQRLVWMSLAATPIFVIASLIESNLVAILFLVVIYVAFLAITWSRLLTSQERELLQNPMQFLAMRKMATSPVVESTSI